MPKVRNKYINVAKDFVFKHRYLFGLIVFILIFGRISSFLIDKNTIILSGEYVYSLDYIKHWNNILDNIRWGDHKYIIQCIDCNLIYHYSWWYSYVLFFITSTGQYLGYNAFIFYVSVGLILQLLGIYIIWRLFFKEVHPISVFLSFFILTFSVYKISLISSGSWYGFNCGVLTILFIFWIYIIKNLKYFNNRQLILYGCLWGGGASLLTNITINYLPIFIYVIILMSLFFSRIILRNYKKVFLFVGSIAVLFVISTIPFWLGAIDSYKEDGQKLFVESVNNELLNDAVFVRAFSHIENQWYIVLVGLFLILSFLLFFLSQKIKLKNKLFLLGLYIFFVIILMGNKMPIFNLYGWIFENVPLMNMIRSSHRFFYFILLLQSLLVFYNINYLQNLKTGIRKTVLLSSYIIIVLIIFIFNINYAKNILFISKIPEAYEQVSDFFDDKTEAVKIYLPFGLPAHQSISENYLWSVSDKPQSKTLYHNPFRSIYFIKNLIVPYGNDYSMSSYDIKKIKNSTFFDFQFNAIDEIVKHLESTDIEYIIIDNYFLWEKYGLSGEELITKVKASSKIKQEQCFGDICIFHKKSKMICDVYYYGNIIDKKGYCLSGDINKIIKFNQKTKDEYRLENYKLLGNNDEVKIINPVENKFFSYSITNHGMFNYIMKNGILFPEKLVEFQHQKENVIIFEYDVELEDKKLFFSIFQSDQNLVDAGVIEIFVDDEKIESISGKRLSEKNGFRWYEIDLKEYRQKSIIIKTSNKGYYLLGYPIIK